MNILTIQDPSPYEVLNPIQFHNLYLKLFDLYENGKLIIDDEHYLRGSIKVDKAYTYAVDFLRECYQDYGLIIDHVNSNDPYYAFQDSNTQLGVANTWGGQNPGVTESQMKGFTYWPNGNTLKALPGWKDAEYFNEFSKFIRMTTPTKAEMFKEMPKLKEIDCSHLTKLTDRFFHNSYMLYKVGADENNELPNLLNIGVDVFNRTAIETISIPNLVETTLPCIFYECPSLKTAHIDGFNLTTINNGCFYYNNELTSITGLSQITKINSQAFRHCTKLNHVDNIDKVTYFGEMCFYECTLLDPDISSAEYIYGRAFAYSGITNANLQNIVYLTNGLQDCRSLRTVTFGDNYIDYSIVNAAFYGDISLETINLDNCIEIGGEAFRGCNSLRTIGNTSNLLRFTGSYNFTNCYVLESINLVNIKTIPYACFWNCYNLSTIGDITNVERIDGWAFENSGLEGSIELTNVEILGKGVFCGCSKLESINLGTNITYINDTSASDLCKGCTSLTTFIAPKLKTIYRSDFDGCTSLTTLSVPECTAIESWAFNNCTSLTTLNLPKVITMSAGLSYSNIINFTAPLLIAINSETFRGCTKLVNVSITSVETIGYRAFQGCNHLETISAMPNLRTIDYSAFDSCSLLEGTINIPNIESIGTYTFNDCTEIEHIILSNKLKNINSCTFYNCTNLRDITNTDAWESVGRSALRNCNHITSLDLSNLKTITTDGSEGYQFAGMTLLETVTSLENLESISGWRTFENCIALRTAPISNKLTVMGDATFYNCKSLENVGDLTGLIEINYAAYYNTPNLNYSGNLPNVEFISARAFYMSGIGPNLNLPKWERYASGNDHWYFAECPNIVTVNIPSLNIIPNNTFYKCTNLESVTFSENLTEIGPYAFQECSKLNNVVLPATVTTMKNQCFHYCTSLKTMTVKATTPPDCSNGNTFAGVTFDVIYVPAESIDAYKNATIWRNHASKFQPIPS